MIARVRALAVGIAAWVDQNGEAAAGKDAERSLHQKIGRQKNRIPVG